jgi:dolichol-phosphate mannosyltransferase
MIVVILPAYNEQDAIVPLIGSLRAVASNRFLEKVRIVVVDDGSSDATAARVEALADADTLLVRHPANRGLGEAIKTGFQYALGIQPQVNTIVTMDADNTHSAGLLPRLVAGLDEGNDLVIASRYRPGARLVGLAWYRELLSTGMSWMFRLLLPIRGVRDYSCGYRAYRADLLRRAFDKWGDGFVDQSGFSCMVDILLKLNRLGAVMSEVPLILHYDLKRGASKMNVGQTVRQTLRLAWRERVQRWGPRSGR